MFGLDVGAGSALEILRRAGRCASGGISVPEDAVTRGSVPEHEIRDRRNRLTAQGPNRNAAIIPMASTRREQKRQPSKN